MYQTRFKLSIRRMAKIEFGYRQNPKVQNMKVVIYQSIFDIWLILTILKLYLVSTMFQAQY